MNKMSKAIFILILFTLIFPAGCKNGTDEKKPSQATKKNEVEKKEVKIFKVSVGTSVFKGPENAPVTIINFSDFQCPFSKRSVSMIDQLMKKYDGKIKYVFKHYPLGFHKLAKPAALAAVAAHKQGKFWE